jgi:multisubunit Na+/H+ antiporter MnhF subunit
MMAWLRHLSPRAEKTIRLVSVCTLAAVLGIIAVARDSEPVGYAAMALVLLGILAGPVVARFLFRPRDGSA